MSLIDVLRSTKDAAYRPTMYGIFVDGVNIVVSNKRVYMTVGHAKGQLLKAFAPIRWSNPHFSEDKIKLKEELEDLIRQGIVEIKPI